jgi:hypothetical protein
MLPAHQWDQPLPMQRFETAFCRAWADNLPSPDRLGEAFEVVCSQVSQLEQFADQPPRTGRNDHRTGCRQRL